MPIEKTAGVVIKSYDYHEADRLLILFTEKLGKVCARARGVRKIKSKQAGKLEIPTLGEFRLHGREGRDVYLLVGVKARQTYRRLKGELERWLTACYCLELLNEMSAEQDPQERFWALILETLGALEKGGPVKVVTRGFEQKILLAAGYALETERCVGCGGALGGEGYGFDPLQGGILCRTCHRRGAGSRLSLHGDSIRSLKLLREKPLVEYGEELAPRQDAELSALSRMYVESIIERELKTPRVIREVMGSGKREVGSGKP